MFAAAAAALALALDDHCLTCGGFSCSSGATPGTSTEIGTGIEARDVTLKPEEDDEEAAVLGLATAGAVALDVRAAAASAVACAASSALAFVANCAATSVALIIVLLP